MSFGHGFAFYIKTVNLKKTWFNLIAVFALLIYLIIYAFSSLFHFVIALERLIWSNIYSSLTLHIWHSVFDSWSRFFARPSALGVTNELCLNFSDRQNDSSVTEIWLSKKVLRMAKKIFEIVYYCNKLHLLMESFICICYVDLAPRLLKVWLYLHLWICQTILLIEINHFTVRRSWHLRGKKINLWPCFINLFSYLRSPHFSFVFI